VSWRQCDTHRSRRNGSQQYGRLVLLGTVISCSRCCICVGFAGLLLRGAGAGGEEWKESIGSGWHPSGGNFFVIKKTCIFLLKKLNFSFSY
jgi:hypothetical protein